MSVLKNSICAMALIFIIGCTTANHGTFVPSTYTSGGNKENGEFLGNVVGESTHVWFLYVLPVGEAPSTREAIADAKSKYQQTTYLTDLAIGDRTHWSFGYSTQVIKVEANAYK